MFSHNIVWADNGPDFKNVPLRLVALALDELRDYRVAGLMLGASGGLLDRNCDSGWQSALLALMQAAIPFSKSVVNSSDEAGCDFPLAFSFESDDDTFAVLQCLQSAGCSAWATSLVGNRVAVDNFKSTLYRRIPDLVQVHDSIQQAELQLFPFESRRVGGQRLERGECIELGLLTMVVLVWTS